MTKKVFQKSNPIYLFQHVPKCAGVTVEYHLEQCFRRGRWVKLNQKTQTKQEVIEYVRTVQPKTDRLISLHGHRVFYGLHEVSRRRPRYFTFLRNPVDRLASQYKHWADRPERRDLMYPNGTLLSFERFVEFPQVQNVMLRMLACAMEGKWTPGAVLTPPFETHVAAAMRFLDLCWFIGFVEEFDEDFGFVTSEMGLPQYVECRNVSRSLLRDEDRGKAATRILELNAFDVELYAYARRLRGRPLPPIQFPND